MGIAAGLLLSAQIPYYVPLLLDCQSALASARDAHRPHHKPAGHKKCGIIRQAMHTEHTGIARPLKWVKGHPERVTKDKNKWTRQQWAIYIADLAAEGN